MPQQRLLREEADDDGAFRLCLRVSRACVRTLLKSELSAARAEGHITCLDQGSTTSRTRRRLGPMSHGGDRFGIDPGESTVPPEIRSTVAAQIELAARQTLGFNPGGTVLAVYEAAVFWDLSGKLATSLPKESDVS